MRESLPRTAPTQLVYSVDEAASVLRVGKVTVYRLLKEKVLRRCKIGRRTVVPAADVAALVERLATGGAE